MEPKHPSSKRYPREVKDRAVALVFSAIEASGERQGHVSRIARQLDIGAETLRKWVRQAEIDGGKRPGITTQEHRRIVELGRGDRELRAANELLKAAPAFFAREPDPALPG